MKRRYKDRIKILKPGYPGDKYWEKFYLGGQFDE